MKRNKTKRLLAFVFALVLVFTTSLTGFAAGNRKGNSNNNGNNGNNSSSSWNNNSGNSGSNSGTSEDSSDSDASLEIEDVEVTEDPSADSSTSDSSSASESLVGESSSGDSSMNRAVTVATEDYGISLADDDGDSDTSYQLKYFSVTMYDYDEDTINDATHQAEVDEGLSDVWNGIYFSGGSPSATSYSYSYDTGEEFTAWIPVSLDELVDGETYVIVGYRGQALSGTYSTSTSSKPWESSSTYSITGSATGAAAGGNIDESNSVMSSATAWTITKTSSGYTISATINGSTRYMSIGNASGTTETNSVTLTISETSYGDNSVSIGDSSGSYWLNQNGGSSGTTYVGYGTDGSSDNGSRFYIYKLGTTTIATETTESLSYADWNFWTDYLDDATGNYLFSGLASSSLASNGDILFNVPDGGIFNSDSSVKSIYTNVEMPFVYDTSTYTYTFDSDSYGVYFKSDDTQESTTAQSNGRLYFSETTQALTNGADDAPVWAPYNDTESVTTSTMDYHFGMKATIPFTMTSDGTMKDSSDEDQDIVFTFSGDDDVWVYIDGTLVIDLGGIKNRLDATINFAQNTVTLEATASEYTTYGLIGDANTNTVDDVISANLLSQGWTYDSVNGTFTHLLFNSSSSASDGLINSTLETFAASTSHELTIFYLERGMGSSNCKITFNLPIYDYLSVTKQITQSKDDEGNVSPLTEAEQAMVDNVDFGFTLYAGYKVVTYETYSIVNADGQVVGSASTDGNGHFTLKNGQTARFANLQFSSTTSTEYYVVEDSKSGYTDPKYSYSASMAGEYTVTADASGLTSMKVSVTGSNEAEDSLTFVCTNYLSANLPNPGALMSDEEIVIDYGLSVVISPLDNEVYRGESIEVVSIKAITEDSSVTTGTQTDNATLDTATTIEGTYGTATLNSNGTITYQLTKQLTGVEVIEYEVKVTGTGNTGDQETVACAYNTGKVYIIPATIMYYEENFGGITYNSDGTTVASSGIVTFTTGKSSGWTVVGSAKTGSQEPGVVGTLNDSTYGSDAAYINDGGQDSNGTSMYVNTINGAAQFSYTFTGTGTSFFARTSSTSGYMKIEVSSSTVGDFETIVEYRDTYYGTDDTDTVLYNIPVYTLEGLSYGTYTVTVTIPKANATNGYGSEFWLDGIRILNPLSSADANYGIGISAYATDGESNMTTVPLRNKLLSTDSEGNAVWDENSFVVFTDTNGEITTAEEYTSIGPKEEVYLTENQSVTFALENWNADTNNLYLGIKAPTGSGTVSINGNTLFINSAVDSYYEISNYASISGTTATFVIKCTGNTIISLTNIKVTGNASFAIIPVEDMSEEETEDETDNEDIEEEVDVAMTVDLTTGEITVDEKEESTEADVVDADAETAVIVDEDESLAETEADTAESDVNSEEETLADAVTEEASTDAVETEASETYSTDVLLETYDVIIGEED